MTARRQPAQTPARRPDWVERLDAALTAARGRAFRWGEHDCCLFPCDMVAAMTGADLARGFRGRYRSLRGALRLLARSGGIAGIAERVAARHAIAEVPPALARRGDVVLVEGGQQIGGLRLELGAGGPHCLAVVGLGGAAAWAAGPDGLVEVPMPFWRRAWRVG